MFLLCFIEKKTKFISVSCFKELKIVIVNKQLWLKNNLWNRCFIFKMLYFLIDIIFVTYREHIFQQIIGTCIQRSKFAQGSETHWWPWIVLCYWGKLLSPTHFPFLFTILSRHSFRNDCCSFNFLFLFMSHHIQKMFGKLNMLLYILHFEKSECQTESTMAHINDTVFIYKYRIINNFINLLINILIMFLFV